MSDTEIKDFKISRLRWAHKCFKEKVLSIQGALEFSWRLKFRGRIQGVGGAPHLSYNRTLSLSAATFFLIKSCYPKKIFFCTYVKWKSLPLPFYNKIMSIHYHTRYHTRGRVMNWGAETDTKTWMSITFEHHISVFLLQL